MKYGSEGNTGAHLMFEMDLRVVHGTANSLAGNMFTPRGEMGFVDFRSREELNVRRADVKHRPFVQPLYRTSKDVDPRQIVSLNERHQNGFQRPEFTR